MPVPLTLVSGWVMVKPRRHRGSVFGLRARRWERFIWREPARGVCSGKLGGGDGNKKEKKKEKEDERENNMKMTQSARLKKPAEAEDDE